MKQFFILLFSVCFLCPTILRAQETDSAGVVILADARLEVLSHKATSHKAATTTNTEEGSSTTSSTTISNAPSSKPVRRSGVIRSARGFRIQIYNGNDRNKAIKLKIDCIRRFPKLETYMTYIQPQFRVKVGNFPTRAEAQRYLQQMSSAYSPIMIVPDIIVINTFKDD